MMQPVPLLQLEDLHSLGVVVRDLESKLDNYVNYLGVERHSLRVVDMAAEGRCVTTWYYGREISYAIKYCLVPLGNTVVELIQPLAEAGDPFSDFLARHGEGVHHVQAQAASYSGFEALMAQLGVQRMNENKDKPYIYYDSTELFGFTLELVRFTHKRQGRA